MIEFFEAGYMGDKIIIKRIPIYAELGISIARGIVYRSQAENGGDAMLFFQRGCLLPMTIYRLSLIIQFSLYRKPTHHTNSSISRLHHGLLHGRTEHSA